jgi:flavin reductase (DIM6/NTAB) family NADH-FMN oxidoreductase RutF
MKEISVSELQLNPMTMIAKEWMLVTAGNARHGYNTMTASWGHLGSIWGHGGGLPTAVVYLRPQRYTKEFVDREELFTITVFSEEYRKALGYLGSHSGRDGDKVAAAGLTPVFEEDFTTFAEAKLTLVCRKLYRGSINADGFVDQSIIAEHYPKSDFHDFYIGQIIKAFVQD